MRTTAIVCFVALHVACVGAADRRLNNLVTELLDVSNPKGGRPYEFGAPRRGFVWIRLDAELFAYGVVSVTVDGKPTCLTGDARRQPPFEFGLPEAVVRLSKGRHFVEVHASGQCELQRLRVHATPQIALYVYVEDSTFLYGRDSYTAFRWEWAKRNGLLNYTTIVTMPPTNPREAKRWEQRLAWWKARGRSVVFNAGISGQHARARPAPNLEDVSREQWGHLLASPLCDGVIIDEVGYSSWYVDRYKTWIAAARRLVAQFPQKDFTFFCVARHFPEFDPMLRAAAEGPANLFLAPEHYYGETQTEGLMRSWSAGHFKKWRRAFPTIAAKTHLYLSVGNASTYAGFDWDPGVDYKPFLDRYVKFFAVDDKTFDGVAGIGFWKINLCDEEAYRFLAALLRHYCLFGATTRFCTDPLRPGVLQNGGFECGTLAGWDARGGVKVVDLPVTKSTGWKRLPEGKKAAAFALRGDSAPALSQKLKRLQPDRLYTAECYTMTFSETTQLERHPVRLEVWGAQIVRRSVRVSHEKRPRVGRKGLLVVCWNRHCVLFRPRAADATLTITAAGTRADAAGQRILVDFIQVQPYFAGPGLWGHNTSFLDERE